MGLPVRTAEVYQFLGLVTLSQKRPNQAIVLLETALSIQREENVVQAHAWTSYLLGRSYLALGDRQQAARCFQLAAESSTMGANWWMTKQQLLLSGLETALGREAFVTYCQRFRQRHADLEESSSSTWYLEPAATVPTPGPLRAGWTAQEIDLDGWTWRDPAGDCAYAVQEGVTLRAPIGHHLWGPNRLAPRLLRGASGDLVLQAATARVSPDRPANGGLLLWRDKENYLHLARDSLGDHALFFSGYVDDQRVNIGRGQLAADAKQIWLRLERTGDRVRALCSADGREWFTVGQSRFPADDPVQAGVYLVSWIDREVFLGPHPEGTAIRFPSLALYAQGDL
jgi:regulation of enolase protein 1 (concanavalin A-like superfamily)